MAFNFVQNNHEGIVELNTKVAEVISNLNIDTEGELTVAKCLKISGEINKCIKSVKSLASAIQNVNPEDKVGVIFAVTVETLNSEEVKSLLNENQRKQVEKFCEDTESVEAIIGMVDWIADETLEAIDSNKDGVVTQDEVEECCAKSCGCCKGCCPGFLSSLAKCWGSCFMKFCCCKSGKNSAVKYQEPKPVNTTDISVEV